MNKTIFSFGLLILILIMFSHGAFAKTPLNSTCIMDSECESLLCNIVTQKCINKGPINSTCGLDSECESNMCNTITLKCTNAEKEARGSEVKWFMNLVKKNTGKAFCVPKGTKLREGVEVLTKFSKAHPEIHDQLTDKQAIQALAESYPCTAPETLELMLPEQSKPSPKNTVTFADQYPQLYTAFIDYDAFHTQLIDRCASRFPETAQSLRTAIAQWSKKNLPALQEFRALSRNEMVNKGIPEKEADTRNAQAVAKITQFMTKNIATMPDSKLGLACSGEYAAQLASPEMDYVVFLEQIKAALKQGKYKTTANQEERQIIRLINEKSVNNSAVDWSPDGKSIATAGDPMQVTIWDSVSLSIRHQLNQGIRDWGGDSITFSPDSQYLASGLGAVNVWNVADGTLKATLIAPHITQHKPQYRGIESLRFSPDGRMLVVVYTGDKQIVIAYRIADGKVAWTYEPQLTLDPQRTKRSPLLTTPLVFTIDGKRVIFCTAELGALKGLSRILLLDAESGEFLRSIDDNHMNNTTALALSRDGKWVATGTSTGERYELTNKKTHQVVTFENQDPVRIWSVETGKLVRELPVHSRVWSLTFSQNGKYLFGATRNINVWDVESGKMVQEIRSNPEPMSLALSPDGERLAAACQNKLSIYGIMNFQ